MTEPAGSKDEERSRLDVVMRAVNSAEHIRFPDELEAVIGPALVRPPEVAAEVLPNVHGLDASDHAAWAQRLAENLGHVRAALGASWYHLRRAAKIEGEVERVSTPKRRR